MNATEKEALYGLIGKAVLFIQYVEDALCTYLTLKCDVKVRGEMPAAEAEVHLEKSRLATLGTSLRRARNAAAFSNQMQERLEQFKEERDWLIHRLVHLNGDDLYDDGARVGVFSRLDALSQEALALQKAVYVETENFTKAQGVTEEQIERGVIKRFKALLGL